MDSRRFQCAEQLFHEALALTPAARERHIDQAAGEDRELALRVRRMIRYAERGPVTAEMLGLQSDAGDAPPKIDRASAGHVGQDLIGACIGPYRILDLLGEGGFGAVYRAEQAAPVRRTVALKILKNGMDSRSVMARFDAERHTLALMEHANIARVFDAGQTAPDAPCGSRPYFVMELVGGGQAQAITGYCDQRRMDWKARLELFRTVCHAVQHAHHKGVIHRDLKPSNILVCDIDGVPTPKVIDFGIAKALEQGSESRVTARPMMTQRLEMLGTPQYMSPEQAGLRSAGGTGDAGVDVDTRSDVYSLGVVLYQLLTGTTPLEAQSLAGVSLSQVQRMICEAAVERPSTRLMRLGDAANEIAQQQDTDATTLRRRLRGDLDWITLKALEVDRERRYSSPAALADDIQRYLQHQPTLAGPPSAAYRLRKFVRRHRVGVAAAAIVTLALASGAIIATVAMLRARNAADEALEINRFMTDVLMSPQPDRSGAQVPLSGVLHTASRTASARFADHPEIEAQVRDLLGRVFLNLDMRNESIAEFRQAATLVASMHGEDDRRTLSQRLRYVQALIHAERSREAEQNLLEIMPRIERLTGPNDVLTLEAEMFMASVHRSRGRYDESERMFRSVLARGRETGVDDFMRFRMVDGLISMLRTRRGQAGDREEPIRQEIESLARELVELAERHFGPGSLPLVRARVTLADSMLERGDAAGAAELCRRVLELSQDRLGDCHGQRVNAMGVLAKAIGQLGDWSGAADHYLKVIECTRAQEHDFVSLLSWISGALPYLDHGGRWAEGEMLAREFCSRLQEFGGGHDDMLFNGQVYVARFVSLQDRHTEAEGLFHALLPRENEADDSQSRARLHLFYGSYLRRRGLYEQAERSLLTAAGRLGGDIRRGAELSKPDDVIMEFIALYDAWGKPERAAEYRAMLEAPSQPVAAEN